MARQTIYQCDVTQGRIHHADFALKIDTGKASVTNVDGDACEKHLTQLIGDAFRKGAIKVIVVPIADSSNATPIGVDE